MEDDSPHIKINIPIATAQLGSSVKIDIPNEYSFREVMIVYNAPALTGGAAGSYIPNSIIRQLSVIQDGRPSINLIANVDIGIAPYAIQMLRELAKMKNRIADTAEYLILRFPGLQSKGGNTYIDVLINTLINIQTVTTGDRTTLTGGTLNVWLKSSERIPRKETRVIRNCGCIPLSTLTGRLSSWINPTEKGYKAKSLMLYIEDDNAASNDAVAELELWKGSHQFFKGPMVQLQEKAKGKYGIAHATGFLKLDINKAVNPLELQLIHTKTAAGTDVNIHWMLTSVKKIR